MQQNFVLETQRLSIPGYPEAFNPSIVRWKNSLLLSFRAREPLTGFTNIVGFVWLDSHFNIRGSPYLLEWEDHSYPQVQDPRLITLGDKLYIVYNTPVQLAAGRTRRMFIAEVQYNGQRFVAHKPEVFLYFEGDPKNLVEKNWVPFEYNKSLLLSYSIVPHKVFYPRFGTKSCETVAYSESYFPWQWGDIRGGTPALKVGDDYLAFFHSCTTMKTVHSDHKSVPYYFMGAYTFSSNPPFELKKASLRPIVGENFYQGPAYKTWKPLRVVFPGGFIYDDKFIWIVYGRQDHEAWVVKLDKQKLLNSLIPVYPE